MSWPRSAAAGESNALPFDSGNSAPALKIAKNEKDGPIFCDCEKMSSFDALLRQGGIERHHAGQIDPRHYQ